MEKRGAGKWGDGRKDYFIFLYCSHYRKSRSSAVSAFVGLFFVFLFKGEEGRSDILPSIPPREDETFLKK